MINAIIKSQESTALYNKNVEEVVYSAIGVIIILIVITIYANIKGK
jgi:hypothetical protein